MSASQLAPIDILIGGPLAALVNASALAAKTTADFISQVGFEQYPPYPARTFGFEFERMTEDAYYPGQFDRQRVSTSVPVLAITPIPFIRIGEATIDLEIKVVGAPVVEDTQSNSPLSSGPGSPLAKRVTINGAYTYQKPVREPTDLSATLKVNIKVVQEPIPEGLARVLTLLHDAVISNPK